MKRVVLLLLVGSVSLLAFDSAAVYKQCWMCHGEHAEKSALRQSPQLGSLSQSELTQKLVAIIDKSSTMSNKYKKMHEAKLKKVSVDEASLLADYIKGL